MITLENLFRKTLSLGHCHQKFLDGPNLKSLTWFLSMFKKLMTRKKKYNEKIDEVET